jgi:hypothetical protein
VESGDPVVSAVGVPQMAKTGLEILQAEAPPQMAYQSKML